MRFANLFILFCFYLSSSAQQEPGCRTNLFVEATLDSIVTRIDTIAARRADSITRSKHSGFVDYAMRRIIFYKLKPPGEAYKIISFRIVAVDADDRYINEVECNGDAVNEKAMLMLALAKKDRPVFFTCIKVKHISGAIFTLKDITFSSPLVFRWVTSS